MDLARLRAVTPHDNKRLVWRAACTMRGSGRKGVCRESALQELGQLLGGHVAVSEDLVGEAGPNGLTRMHGHNRASPILVPQEMMTVFDPDDEETSFTKHRNEFQARNTRSPAHAAMVTR